MRYAEHEWANAIIPLLEEFCSSRCCVRVIFMASQMPVVARRPAAFLTYTANVLSHRHADLVIAASSGAITELGQAVRVTFARI